MAATYAPNAYAAPLLPDPASRDALINDTRDVRVWFRFFAVLSYVQAAILALSIVGLPFAILGYFMGRWIHKAGDALHAYSTTGNIHHFLDFIKEIKILSNVSGVLTAGWMGLYLYSMLAYTAFAVAVVVVGVVAAVAR